MYIHEDILSTCFVWIKFIFLLLYAEAYMVYITNIFLHLDRADPGLSDTAFRETQTRTVDYANNSILYFTR